MQTKKNENQIVHDLCMRPVSARYGGNIQPQYLYRTKHLSSRKPEPSHLITQARPPFRFPKASYHYRLALQEQQQRDFGVEGSRYQSQRSQKLEHRRHRSNEHRESQKEARHYGSPGEEHEGETSGYASDSVDVPQTGQSESSWTLVPLRILKVLLLTRIKRNFLQ